MKAKSSHAALPTETHLGIDRIECLPSCQDLTPDVLDRLLGRLCIELQTDAGEQPSKFHVWPSIRIVYPIFGDDTATWSLRACSAPFNHSRYQVLPYFASYHWQLAVFDQVQHVITRYDSAWEDGTDRFTFSVLQKWLDSNGGNRCPNSYEYAMIKVGRPCPASLLI